jgi:hypothetical protein
MFLNLRSEDFVFFQTLRRTLLRKSIVSGIAVVRRLHRKAQIFNPFAHSSTMPKRSETVQMLFSTPAAIAGMHRIAP